MFEMHVASQAIISLMTKPEFKYWDGQLFTDIWQFLCAVHFNYDTLNCDFPTPIKDLLLEILPIDKNHTCFDILRLNA